MPTPGRKPKRKRGLRALLLLVVLSLFAVQPGCQHARAAALLLRFEAGDTRPSGFAAFGAHDVVTEETTVDTPEGPMPARYYLPVGVSDPPGLVISHGIHNLGIEEPRLKRFARTIASAGVVVLTPQLDDLADYRVDMRSAVTIGRAAMKLRDRVHRTAVGVLGLSFSGGLALLAASNPQFAPAIDFVVAVGAHDDLARVSRFFVSSTIAEPDGTQFHIKAHDYGAVVLVYSYIQLFFPDRDVAVAREAVRDWLHEKFDDARKVAQRLSPAGKATMELVFDHREDVLGPKLLAAITKAADRMKRVSPHGNIGGLRAHVYLLHGAGDTVIPASETRWLAVDAPPGTVQDALVSPAIQHVELHGKPSLRDQANLVHFMALLLGELDREAPTGE